MNFRIAVLAAACIGAASFSVAQQTTPPARDTSPPSATSPSTQSEAPTPNSTNPSAASSPHQRQAMAKSGTKMSMKDCIAKERSENSGMSKNDARKACKEMKNSTEPTKSEPTNR